MNPAEGPSFHTPGFAHYSLAWSPFHDGRLAVASAANFGLVGNGRLHLTSLRAGGLALDKQFETRDGLYDVAWSEIHENQLVTASGDGSLRLWDVTINTHPIRAWNEHTREAMSVDWSNVAKDQFVSASWDGTVRVWTPERAHSITTIHASRSCVYQALFSPHQPHVISTASADGTLKLFDVRVPAFASGPGTAAFAPPLSQAVLTIPASGTEVLSVDWNKYRPYVLASGSVDKSVRVWDARMVQPRLAGAPTGAGEEVAAPCEAMLEGHEYAVRKVQWSPHRAEVLASAGYDMTCRVWATNAPPGQQLRMVHDRHTEFVVGCAWALYEEGMLASSGWDGRVNIYRV